MAYFEDREHILYLSDDYIEKQQIEDGINRNLIPVRSIGSLVEEIDSSINQMGRVTVIVTSNMADEFKAYLDNLVNAFSTVPPKELQVVEIGIGEVFEGALSFVNILSFIEFVRKERRIEYINDLEEMGEEEESHILRELMVEVESSRERVDMYKKDIENLEGQIEEAEARYQKLKTTVDHVYVIQIKNFEMEIKKMAEELEEINRLYKIEKEKVRDYEREASEYRSQNKALELDTKSLMMLVETRKQDMRIMENEIKKHKKDIEKLQKEKLDILQSRVDAEEHVMLSKELDRERKKVGELEKSIELITIESRKKDFDISDLQEDIDDLRKGEEDIRERGRTQILDKYDLRSTNLFYFKVITDLPYLMSSMREFMSILRENGSGRTHVMILRNDEGLDSLYYEGYELYGTLQDVKESDEVFLLHPTRRMFTGIEKFDESVDTLVVLDYIRSKEYYLSTKALGKYITVVNESSMLRKFELKGTPISLDSGSLLDITYDQRIDDAATKKVRDSLIRKKVETWMKKLDIL